MTPRFSLVVPALNEAGRIGATLAAARAALGERAEYIVVDGGSTDSTTAIALQAGARVIHSPRGRGEQLERGRAVARGEICIFLHADTMLPMNAAAAIERALAPRGVTGGAFMLRFPDTDRGLRLLAYFINLRSRGFATATGDQAMFADSATLARAGGVPRVPLFEDVRLCRLLKRHGRFVVVREKVTTSARLWQGLGTLRGILLHLTLRALHALGAPPRRLVRFYPHGL